MLVMGIACFAIPVQSIRFSKGVSLEVHGIVQSAPTTSLQTTIPATGAVQPRLLVEKDRSPPDTNTTAALFSVPSCAVSKSFSSSLFSLLRQVVADMRHRQAASAGLKIRILAKI
jgi:hypothetical protein